MVDAALRGVGYGTFMILYPDGYGMFVGIIYENSKGLIVIVDEMISPPL